MSLQAELAAAKLVDESSIVAELRKRVADQGNGCAEGLTTIPVIILSHAADYITHVQTKLRREEEKTEARKAALELERLLDTKQSRIDRLEAELKRASEALRDAAEEVEGWGSYADEHFQKKWDLPACVANINKAADAIDAALNATAADVEAWQAAQATSPAAPTPLKQHSRFTCPKCGSHKFGTSIHGDNSKDWVGHCGFRVDDDIGCQFSWPRTDDHLYFTAP